MCAAPGAAGKQRKIGAIGQQVVEVQLQAQNLTTKRRFNHPGLDGPKWMQRTYRRSDSGTDIAEARARLVWDLEGELSGIQYQSRSEATQQLYGASG